MPEQQDAAVTRRAKALAEQDGFAWELNCEPIRPYEEGKGKFWLTEERRRQYLDRARTDLQKETGAS